MAKIAECIGCPPAFFSTRFRYLGLAVWSCSYRGGFTLAWQPSLRIPRYLVILAALLWVSAHGKIAKVRGQCVESGPFPVACDYLGQARPATGWPMFLDHQAVSARIPYLVR